MGNKLKLGLILASDSHFLGGLAQYQRNLIPHLSKKFEVFLISKSSRNKKEISKNFTSFEIKCPRISLIENFFFEFRVKKFLKKNHFDIINSQGFTGLWMNFPMKKTKLVHTYHGSTYHFYKNHLKRFNLLRKIIFSPVLIIPYFIERKPLKKADKIICVSEHVKEDLSKLHGKRKRIKVIRTGVDLEIFKKKNKKDSRKKLKLNSNKTYGLYVGRGGFWTKGLDKTIKLSKEIYKINNNFRLLIIGADKKKIQHLLDKRFTLLLPPQKRGDIPLYYSASDIFFSMSRCEGGAPTMVTSEAMASGNLIITDKEANQEIFKDRENGIVIKEDYSKEAKRISNILKNKRKVKEILRNSQKTVEGLSLEKWAKKYLDFLYN